MSGLNSKKFPKDQAEGSLAEEAKQGNVRAIARLISLVENHDQEEAIVLRSLNETGNSATVVGITGYPGAGKSTLVNQLTRLYRGQGKKVGIIAVDPSSPKTGGALLGDRIRMQDHANDPGVFIRSMATRGFQGGLAQTTRDVVNVLRATGYEIILLETVGVGQGEVDVAQVADVVLAVLAPDLGDEVQALKAGLLEIADIVAVNKKDQPGAEVTKKHLQEWVPRLILTEAITGEGVDCVMTTIAELERRGKPQTAGDANAAR